MSFLSRFPPLLIPVQQLKRDLADANTEIKKKDIEVRDASKDISKMKKQVRLTSKYFDMLFFFF